MTQNGIQIRGWCYHFVPLMKASSVGELTIKLLNFSVLFLCFSLQATNWSTLISCSDNANMWLMPTSYRIENLVGAVSVLGWSPIIYKLVFHRWRVIGPQLEFRGLLLQLTNLINSSERYKFYKSRKLQLLNSFEPLKGVLGW